MKTYELIIFDWDGTLMDSAERIVNCFNAAARNAGVAQAQADQIRSLIGIGLDQAFVQLYPEISQNKIEALVEYYRQHWLYHDRTPMPLFPGVTQGLQELENSGVMLAVATGKSRAGLDRALDELELHSLFTCSRCADEARTKPHPQMLIDILDYTGLNPEQCIMIGDTTYDLEMARHASMDGFGVTYGSHGPELLEPLSKFPLAQNFDELISRLLDGEPD